MFLRVGNNEEMVVLGNLADTHLSGSEILHIGDGVCSLGLILTLLALDLETDSRLYPVSLLVFFKCASSPEIQIHQMM